MLGIVLHELATNAVKYGAFSNEVGTILIARNAEDQPVDERLILTWRETDGPVVVPPTLTSGENPTGDSICPWKSLA